MKRNISQTIPETLSVDSPNIKNVPHMKAKDQDSWTILEYGAV